MSNDHASREHKIYLLNLVNNEYERLVGNSYCSSSKMSISSIVSGPLFRTKEEKLQLVFEQWKKRMVSLIKFEDSKSLCEMVQKRGALWKKEVCVFTGSVSHSIDSNLF